MIAHYVEAEFSSQGAVRLSLMQYSKGIASRRQIQHRTGQGTGLFFCMGHFVVSVCVATYPTRIMVFQTEGKKESHSGFSVYTVYMCKSYPFSSEANFRPPIGWSFAL